MNYEQIKPYIEKGLISENKHPEDSNVRIFNYTQKCQFSGEWDEVTMQCRGLILNVETGEVIARPFPKFFNYSEYLGKDWSIPNEKPIVTSKMDGSLGILYELHGKAWIATRGSFTSDQAKWATAWWRRNIDMFPNRGETSLFEIIYPENRVVVKYDYSGLVHICTLNNSTGKTLHTNWYAPIMSVDEVELVNLDSLAKLDIPNSEGYVIHFPKSNVRMKIKHPEYVRLHKIITGVSEIGIWEMLRDGKPLNELVEKVPDEFFNWVKDVSYKLSEQFNEIATQAQRDFKECFDWLHENGDTENRAQIAEMFKQRKYPNILFAMLDGKPFAPIIWKMIRPHGQTIFRSDLDL